MHGGRELARGALPSKEKPVTNALSHDVIVFSACGAHPHTAVGPMHQGVLTPPGAACLHGRFMADKVRLALTLLFVMQSKLFINQWRP